MYYTALCVASAGSVIGLEAEMEGKMKKQGGWTGRDGIYANTLVGRKKGFIQFFVKTDAITLDPTSTASFPRLSLLYLCSLLSPLFLFTSVSASDYSVIPRDTLFIYSRPTPSSIPSLSCL